jgi:hypothetical protein
MVFALYLETVERRQLRYREWKSKIGRKSLETETLAKNFVGATAHVPVLYRQRSVILTGVDSLEFGGARHDACPHGQICLCSQSKLHRDWYRYTSLTWNIHRLDITGTSTQTIRSWVAGCEGYPHIMHGRLHHNTCFRRTACQRQFATFLEW